MLIVLQFVLQKPEKKLKKNIFLLFFTENWYSNIFFYFLLQYALTQLPIFKVNI